MEAAGQQPGAVAAGAGTGERGETVRGGADARARGERAHVSAVKSPY